MNRILTVTALVLLATQFAVAATASKKVTVKGKLTGGVTVSATCTLSTTGQTSGTGSLAFGTSSYPFVINKMTTGQGGTVILSGNFTVGGKYPVTLTAKVPSGAQTFSYVVNGQTYSMAGQGTVTVQ